MTAQHQSNLSLLQLEVRRIEFQSFPKRGVGVFQIRGIGSLTRSAQKGDCQLVIRLHLFRVGRNLLFRGSNALLRRSLFQSRDLAGWASWML